MRFDLRPRVRRLFRLTPRTPAAVRAELDEELAAIVAEHVDSLVARGVSEGDARATALRRLGLTDEASRVALYRSAERRERRLRLSDYLDDLVRDLRYAARGLARRPAFTALSVTALAIGIGATTAIYGAVDALLVRPLPFARPNELMKLVLIAPDMGRLTGNDQMVWSYPKYLAFRDAQTAFSRLAAYRGNTYRQSAGDVQFIDGEKVTPTYLSTLGVHFVRGRDLDPVLDGRPGEGREVVISYDFWQARYSGDPDAVGRTIELGDIVFTIVGVTEPGFKGLSGVARLWGPITERRYADLREPNSHQFNVIGRRKPGVTVERAAAETRVLGARLEAMYPARAGSAPWSAAAIPLDAARVSPLVRRAVLILFGAVVFVLLIACLNVASLLLGRASGRRREIALRLAIGAGRGRLLRLMLAESVLLAGLGGVAGIAVAWLGVRALSAINPATTLGTARDGGLGAVSFSSIALDWRTLGFALGLSILVGVVFGLIPALAVTRSSLSEALRSSVSGTDRDRGAVLAGRRALVVLEVALALVLLAGSGLMIRSASKLLSTDYGFDGNRVLSVRLTAYSGGSFTDSMPVLWRAVTAKLESLPTVTQVGVGDCSPLSGGCRTTTLKSVDGTAVDPSRAPLVGIRVADGGFFRALRIPLEHGRWFDGTDLLNGPKVAVINEAAARAYFPNENPVGHRIATAGGSLTDGAEIVGVVGDVRQSPDSAAAPEIYASLSQAPFQRLQLFIRTSASAATLGADVRRAIHEASPASAMDDMRTMGERTASATAKARFGAWLLGLFAATALSLAVIGIYGVMSLAVAARTRELGIRIALGADRLRVQRLVVGEGMALVAVGVALGLAGALVCTRALRSLLFELTPTDPATYAAIMILLTVTAAAASWIPARRASHVDPLEALRAD